MRQDWTERFLSGMNRNKRFLTAASVGLPILTVALFSTCFGLARHVSPMSYMAGSFFGLAATYLWLAGCFAAMRCVVWTLDTAPILLRPFGVLPDQRHSEAPTTVDGGRPSHPNQAQHRPPRT